MIAENIEAVRERIRHACNKVGRRMEDVKLVAVTKGVDASKIEEALAAGVKAIGENRVQEAAVKYAKIGDKAEWHLVGHLQTNKVKDAVRIFSLIHSLDTIRLAKEIDKEAQKIGKIQDALIQVNVSGEKSKFGLEPGTLEGFLKEVSSYRNINIKGLMTIAPEFDDPEAARPFFRRLRELRDSVNAVRCTQYAVRILSMGMSNDFEVAIEEGANIVRIGRAIFYDR